MATSEIFDILLSGHNRRAVVMCDGTPPSNELLQSCLDGADLFACTDRAGWPHDQLPRRPDVVIGDLDTLGGIPNNPHSATHYILDENQNTTDTEKALIHAANQGCTQALLLGATGGHLDHTLANCALPERFASTIQTILISDFGMTLHIPANQPTSWALPIGTQFSLMAIGRPAQDVTVTGARWPLLGDNVVWGGASTISNEVTEPLLTISSASGSLLVTIRHTTSEKATA
jgi:thiamine pyrophosphokinase